MAFTAKNAIIKIINGNIGGDDSRYKTLKGLIEAAKANTTITEQDFAEVPGKLRELKVSYFPVDCSETATCADDLCAATAASLTTVSFTLGTCTAAKAKSVGFNDIKNVDGEFNLSDAAVGVISGQMSELRRRINKEAAIKLVALASASEFYDGSTSKTIQLVDPVTGAMRPMGYFEVERALEDVGVTDPYIIGGSDAFIWERGLGIAGLNNNGQNLAGLQKGNVFYDSAIETAFADATTGHLVGFSAETVKFISYADNAGGFANKAIFSQDELMSMFRSGQTYFYGVIPDPSTGLMYNLNIVMSPCAKKWNIGMDLTWDLFNIPNGHCGNDAEVTGAFHFKTCLPVPVVCP